MPCHYLKERILNTWQKISVVHLLTIHGHPCFLDKTVDDLKGLHCSYLSLVLSESVQPSENLFDVVLPPKFCELPCVASSQAIPNLK
jgi:hypothetical protein